MRETGAHRGDSAAGVDFDAVRLVRKARSERSARRRWRGQLRARDKLDVGFGHDLA